jgi:hypothetical protein
MVNKRYPVEFKADAVASCRSRPDASIASIADDLGVNRETLRSWSCWSGTACPRTSHPRSGRRAPPGRGCASINCPPTPPSLPGREGPVGDERQPANLTVRTATDLAAAVKNRLKRMQYRPTLIDGFSPEQV